MSTHIYHTHHILPKHMGGTDDAANLIKLTVEEHANAHKELWEQHGHWQDYLAWQGLSKRIGREDIIRQLISNVNKGRLKTPEHKEKIRQSILGRKHSAETKNKISESGKGNQRRKGKPMSDELKALYSKRQTGVKRGPYKKKS